MVTEQSTAVEAPGRTRLTRPPSAVFGAVVFTISLTLVLAAFQLFSQHPWSVLDLRIYLWGGSLVWHSHDPYLYTYLYGHLHFTYTPMAAGLFALLSVINVGLMKVLFLAGSVASLVGVLWLTWGALGYRRSAARLGATLCVAAVALWLEPVWQTVSFGQVNLILMLVIVADLCLPDSRWWKGVGVGLAAGFKLTPLIFIPYLLLTRRYRAAAVAAATFGLTIVGTLLLLPRASEHYWLDGLALNSNRVGNLRYIGNQSLNGALLRLFGTAAADQPFRLAAVAVVGIAGLLLAAWASRRGQEMAGILVCALTGLLVSPVSWDHHWVWVAPALVVLVDLAVGPRWLAAAGRWRWVGWLGVAAVAVVFSGLLWTVNSLSPTSSRPSQAAQGRVMDGPQQLVGDLYVLAGLITMGAMAVLLARTGSRRTADPEPRPAGRWRASQAIRRIAART
jgi:alpha-1,2-mannosyltransferase